MPLVLVIVGIVLLAAAWRDTAGALGGALAEDVPPFLLWAGALVAVGGLGYVPGLRTVSRGLLALVLVVLVLANYKALFAGLSKVTAVDTTSAADPFTAYALNPDAGGVTVASIQGTGQGSAQGGGNTRLAQPTTSPFGAFDPAAFLTAYQSGTGGFGGVA
jgi:hypothetical protein